MNPTDPTRRRFIVTAGAATAIAGFPNIVRAQGASNAVLKIGLIGSG
ncbi:MAG: twin-arginine translocation signal domain-containing protein, partial [Verrucomicrobiaceae bacterium]